MFNFFTSTTKNDNNDNILDQELIDKSKLLALKSNKKIKESFVWNYKSAFTWEWLDYKESTCFSQWDSIRRIDWINTAKTWKLFVKRFEQTRQMKILLIIDTNNSLNTGISEIKKDKLIESMATLSLGAIHNNDIVGQYFLWHKNYLPFLKWKSKAIKLIEDAYRQKFNNQNIDYKSEFENISNLIKWKTVVFIFSDFANENLINSLKYLNSKHERIWVIIRDDFDQIKEKRWHSEIKDLESWEIVSIDWSKFENFKKEIDLEYEKKKKYFSKYWIRNLEIFENSDVLDSFMKFFKNYK